MEAEDRRVRAARALGNPLYFGEMYVRPFDEAWVSTAPSFAGEMLAFAINHKRGAVILPPEFLKTTMLSQVLPLWLTVKATLAGEVLRGMLLSEEEGMAAANLSVIKWHIDNNEILAHDFADTEGRPLVFPDPEEQTWREDAIIVNRPGAAKDPTWQAKGLDSKGIHGRRLDWLIGDDVVTPKNAFSPAYRRTAMNLWDLQITTRLVRKGRAVIAGNFNHQRDLISTLAARPTYGVYRRPALHASDDPARPDEDGEVLWPENWPRERLDAERADKPQNFRRIFLLDPRAESGERLQDDWMERVDPRQTPITESSFVIGLDAAPGGESHDLDYFNLTILALHPGYYDIVACLDVRRPTPEQIDLLGAVHDRYDRMGNGVIAIAGARQTVDAQLRGAVISVRPDLAHKMIGVAMKGSKESRIENLGPRARSGGLRCWDGVWEQLTSDEVDRHQELTLGEQWRQFPSGKHDDKLDGVDVAARGADEVAAERELEYSLEAL